MTTLLLIGAGGLDLGSLDARLRTGALPRLAALRARGTLGALRNPLPRDGVAPWVSLATGRPPEIHRAWRSDEVWAGGVRPVSGKSWAAPAIWERLAAAGVTTASVDWPASRPGAAWAGEHIDSDFAEPTGFSPAEWALPLDCAPADLRDELRHLRTHPTEITAPMLSPLIPELAAIDQGRDARTPGLAVAMARAATVQAAAAWLLETRRPEALFVHHGWMASVRAAFEADRDGPFSRVVDGAWQFLDGLVGHLVELAGATATVMVVSPGWRTQGGLAMAAGPGVAAGVFEGGQLLDVAPTVLAAFGFGATGLGGRPFAYAAEPRLLAQAPEPPPRSRVEADQELLAVAAADGHPPPPAAAPAWEAQWLAELAYFLLSSSPEAALETADKALARHADLVIALGTKAYACLALERSEPLPALAAALCQAAPTRGWGALTHAAHAVLVGDPRAATPWLQQAERDPDREIQIRTGAVWMAAGRPDQAARLFDALLALDPHDVSAGVGAAMAAMTRRDFRTAEDLLRQAARHDPGAHVVRLQLVIVYARTGRRLEAMAEAQRAVSLGAPPDLAAAALEGGKGPG